MSTIVRRLLLPAGAVLALALPAPALAACTGDAAPSSAAAVAATLCLVNEQRGAQGLPALTESASLDAAAVDFARDMVRRRFFDHISPGGGTMMDRIKASGWVAASGSWAAGENIAWGSGDRATPAAIVDAWMHSADHRANILNRSFAEVGIGVAAGAPQAGITGGAGIYVTDFATRGQASTAASRSRQPVARCATKASRHGRPARRTSRRCVKR